MSSRPILTGPRHGLSGSLLDGISGIPFLGAVFARAQRIRRKRLRAVLASREGPEMLQGAEVRAVADALRKWRELPPHSISLPPMNGAPRDPAKRCSVVINTVDRAGELEKTLHDLQSHWQQESDELIVVLGPGSDNSGEIVAKAEIPCRIIPCPERNLALSRNLGLAASGGEFVAFLDDDASPAEAWLDPLLAPLRNDPDCGVSAGFAMDGEGARFLTRYVVSDHLGDSTWCENWEQAEALIEEVPDRFLSATGCNMAFRREQILQLGGFDPFYAYFLEETDLVLRLQKAGFSCATAADSIVFHRQGTNLARSPEASLSARLRILKSQLHFIRKFASGGPSPGLTYTSIWRRILADLERIAWEQPKQAAILQREYLHAVCEELARQGV